MCRKLETMLTSNLRMLSLCFVVRRRESRKEKLKNAACWRTLNSNQVRKGDEDYDRFQA